MGKGLHLCEAGSHSSTPIPRERKNWALLESNQFLGTEGGGHP
jgi:hypothetical protein